MPKQKSNALVVYSGGPDHCDAKGSFTQQEVKAQIAKAVENLKSQMQKQPQKQNKTSGGSGGIPPYAKLIVDPLNAPLCTRPDYSTVSSNVYRLTDMYSVSTTTAAFAFSAGLYLSNYTTPTYTGTAVTAWGAGTSSQYYTSLNTDNTTFRTILFCVQWIPTANDNNAQGSVHFGFYPGQTTVGGLPLGDISTYADDNGGCFGPADKPACIISRPYVPPFYSGMSSTLAGNFPTVLFAGAGLYAGQSGQIAVTRIVECVPVTGNVPSMTARRQVCDPLACSVGDNVMGSSASYASGVDDPYSVVVKNGMKIAMAASADLENWSGANSMSRTRSLFAAAA